MAAMLRVAFMSAAQFRSAPTGGPVPRGEPKPWPSCPWPSSPPLAVPVPVTLHIVSLRRLLAGARSKDQSTSTTIPTGERTTIRPA
jgi:hypothetical protein